MISFSLCKGGWGWGGECHSCIVSPLHKLGEHSSEEKEDEEDEEGRTGWASMQCSRTAGDGRARNPCWSYVPLSPGYDKLQYLLRGHRSPMKHSMAMTCTKQVFFALFRSAPQQHRTMTLGLSREPRGHQGAEVSTDSLLVWHL